MLLLRIADTCRMVLDAEQLHDAIEAGRVDAAFLEQLDLRHHRRRRPFGDDRAVAQDDDAIALAKLFGLVLDDDEAGALARASAESARKLPRGPRDRDRWSARRGRPRAGRSASTDAIARRCFCPPESVVGSRSSKPRSPTASSAGVSRARISSRGIPTRSIANATSCATVVENSCDSKSWKTMPTSAARSRTRESRNRAPTKHHDSAKIAAFEFGNDSIEHLREGRFARARGAHDADHLADALRQVHLAQRGLPARRVGES